MNDLTIFLDVKMSVAEVSEGRKLPATSRKGQYHIPVPRSLDYSLSEHSWVIAWSTRKDRAMQGSI